MLIHETTDRRSYAGPPEATAFDDPDLGRALVARLSRQDGLTGIANRRGFDERFDRLWRHLARLGRPLGVLLVEVDAFWAFTDIYGSAHADDALRHVARCLDLGVRREADLVARYAGEAFACILPCTDAAGLLRVGGMVHAAVAALGIVHGASPVAPHLSVSVGGVSMLPSVGEPPARLIAAAERCLDAAKTGGCNRVVVA